MSELKKGDPVCVQVQTPRMAPSLMGRFLLEYNNGMCVVVTPGGTTIRSGLAWVRRTAEENVALLEKAAALADPALYGGLLDIAPAPKGPCKIEQMRAAFGVPDWLQLGAVVWTLEEEYCALQACMACGNRPRRVLSYVPVKMTVGQISLSAFLDEKTLVSVSVTGMGDGEFGDLDSIYPTEQAALEAAARLLAEEQEQKEAPLS